jgi:hypothetical protein
MDRWLKDIRDRRLKDIRDRRLKDITGNVPDGLNTFGNMMEGCNDIMQRMFHSSPNINVSSGILYSS